MGTSIYFVHLNKAKKFSHEYCDKLKKNLNFYLSGLCQCFSWMFTYFLLYLFLQNDLSANKLEFSIFSLSGLAVLPLLFLLSVWFLCLWMLSAYLITFCYLCSFFFWFCLHRLLHVAVCVEGALAKSARAAGIATPLAEKYATQVLPNLPLPGKLLPPSKHAPHWCGTTEKQEYQECALLRPHKETIPLTLR